MFVSVVFVTQPQDSCHSDGSTRKPHQNSLTSNNFIENKDSPVVIKNKISSTKNTAPMQLRWISLDNRNLPESADKHG